jgi:hypothetical protein
MDDIPQEKVTLVIARFMGFLCQSGLFLRKERFVVNGNLNVITLLFSKQGGHCTEFTITASITRP